MESKMLGQIIENTDSFVASVSKDKRKKYGQFFTNVTTAKFMASLFNFDLYKPNIEILDLELVSFLLLLFKN